MVRFAVVTSTGCAGFVLRRRHLFEAFGADQISLGTFDTEDGAVTAVITGQNITPTDVIQTSV